MFTIMSAKVQKLPVTVPGSNYLLAVAHKAIAPKNSSKPENRCRFDLFVRKRPGLPGFYTRNGPVRTFCFRGDKFTNEENQMLRNLLKLLIKNIGEYDRVELYDNDKSGEERIIVKITNNVIEDNNLNLYSLMLDKLILPVWLKK